MLNFASLYPNSMVQENDEEPPGLEPMLDNPEELRSSVSERALWNILEERVIDNIHIPDEADLRSAWIGTFPREVKTKMPKEARADWASLYAYLQMVCHFPVASLMDVLERFAPRALTAGPLDCFVMNCNKGTRSAKNVPACDEHMCHHCRIIIRVQPRWQLDYVARFDGSHVHLATRDTEAYRNMREEMSRDVYSPSTLWCPGTTRRCVASQSITRYTQASGCLGLLPTPMDRDMIVFVPMLCGPCTRVNACTIQKPLRDRNQRTDRVHVYDTVNPDRYAHKVCDQADCNRQTKCASCGVIKFVAVETERVPPLCEHCQPHALACELCHRVEPNKRSGFFALRWMWGPTEANAQDARPRWCIWCFPTIDRPFRTGNRRGNACRPEKIRCLLLQWRFARKRARTYLSDLEARYPDNWLEHLVGHEWSTRERVMLEKVPGGWVTLQQDDRSWDSTFKLMYWTVWLPEELFKKVLRAL